MDSTVETLYSVVLDRRARKIGNLKQMKQVDKES